MNNIILKEGFNPILIALAISVFVVVFISTSLGKVLLLFTFFLIFIYRNPSRYIFQNTQNILSLVDGKVSAIDKVDDKYKIYCKVNMCNVHTVRAPIDSTIKVIEHKHGQHLNPYSYKAKLFNEQLKLQFDDMEVEFISGICNGNINLPSKLEVKQGDDILTFLDGLVIITIDTKYTLEVDISDKLVAGQTVLYKKI